MLKQRVKNELNNIRPFLQADGGDVELVDVKENKIYVRLMGTCGDCPFSQSTLKLRIEKSLKKAIPEIESVESI
ncbi:MAG: NifU family protein [bacterium]|nr:MAG: NifU family protein [bacterium]